MDMTNPTYGWEMDSFESMMGEDWTSFEMSNDLHLDDSLDSDWEWSSLSSSSSSSLSTTSKATLSPRGLRGGDAPSPKRVGSRSLGADNDLITSSLLGIPTSSS